MKSILLYILTIFTALLLLLLLLSGITGQFSASTDPIRDAGGETVTESIAELKQIELGGLKQSVLLRGHDRSNPVLLWLHGGPGAAQMPLAHHLDRQLEEEFVVVHWDQRGAGKSNHNEFDEGTMTFDQFFSDTHELTEYLKNRFDQDKIYLLGHSWGSILGVEYADRYPENLQAYIGVSQVVDNRRGGEIAYPWLKEQIQENGSKSDMNTLNELREPPYIEHSDHVDFAGLIGDYGGNFDISMTRMARIAFRAPEYNLRDYYRWLNGANRGSGPMWDEVFAHHIDYMSEIPSLEVPVWFIIGDKDKNTPRQLVEEYYEMIEAPHKELVIFDSSAHTPFLAEPEKFSREIINIQYDLEGQD